MRAVFDVLRGLISAFMFGGIVFLASRTGTLKLSSAGKISFVALCLAGLAFIVCLWGWSLTWRHVEEGGPLQLVCSPKPSDAPRRRAWLWGRAVIVAWSLLVLLVISTGLLAAGEAAR